MKQQEELVEKIRAMMRRRHGSDEPSVLRRAFDEYDPNGDGQIEVADITRVLADADIGNAMTRGVWVKGVMARLDANRDDRISWEEFVAVIKAEPT